VRKIHLGPIVASVFLLAVMPPAAVADSPLQCEPAAQAFLAALAPAEQARAVAAFAPGPREAWSYRPGVNLRKDGLRTGDMSDAQRRAGHALLRCGLSTQGYQKAAAIIRLDDVVRENFRQLVFATASTPVDVGKEFYWLTVFGEPRADRPWGWQIEGHHLALNFTAVDGAVTITPAFMGADPAEIREGPFAGFRVLDGEVARAFDLMASLRPDQRNKAVISDKVPQGLFTSPERAQSLASFEGLPASELDPAQRLLLLALVREYVDNAAPATAARVMQRLNDEPMAQLHFAWMGPTVPGSAVYYRVHGPSLLVEFDHAANIRSKALEPDPNHIHTIMRIPGEDYGEDLLARHYRDSPHHRPPDDPTP
jgi:hypothetical protein